MVISFPMFFGRPNENAREFLDTLKMFHLISSQDTNAVKLRAFPLVLREEAQAWYETLTVLMLWRIGISSFKLFQLGLGEGIPPREYGIFSSNINKWTSRDYSDYESNGPLANEKIAIGLRSF